MGDHPITPPPKLVEQWAHMLEQHTDTEVFAAVARWGADQELEACVNYFLEYDSSWGENSELITGLRADRRPKPPSLKEQALAALKRQSTRSVPSLVAFQDCDIILKALEQLDD